jgi:hypothetical protein
MPIRLDMSRLLHAARKWLNDVDAPSSRAGKG